MPAAGKRDTPGYSSEPGFITIFGTWEYYDGRESDYVAAKGFIVDLLSDSGDFLGLDYTDDYGDFSITGINPGEKVFVRIYTYDLYYIGGSLHEIMVAPSDSGGDYWEAYSRDSAKYGPYSDGSYNLGTLYVPSWLDELDAWWIKDDLDDGFQFLPDKVGDYFADWDPDWGRDNMFCVCPVPYLICDTLGHIQLACNAAKGNPDHVLHEMGHAVMWNVYDEYWPISCLQYASGYCIEHYLNLASGDECAWTEGWANLWAIAVKGSPYLFGYNLETPTWGTSGWDDGDMVEGRVAGALWDIYDDPNDGYDQYDGEFDDIWDTIYNQTDDTFAEFWEAWKARGHNIWDAVGSVYQNTIKYGAVITGETGEVRCDVLPGVTVELFKNNILRWSTTSDDEGSYEVIAAKTGSYEVVASKSGFRELDSQEINITDLQEIYTLDFLAETGLVPNAATMSYALECVSHWLYPPSEKCKLSMTKALEAVSA